MVHVGSARPFNGLAITAIVFGAVALAVPALWLLVSLASIAAQSQALMMVTALLFLPIAGVLGIVIGLVAMILAIVLAVRSRGTDTRWIWALALGLLGAAFVPVTMLVLTGFSG